MVALTERDLRLVLGALILAGLYFNLPECLYTVVFLLLMEGLFNLRITRLLPGLSKQPGSLQSLTESSSRFGFSADRAWRLLLALLLLFSYQYYSSYWSVTWFLGFAILGAGVSGVCPMLMLLRWVGFR